MAYFYGLNKKFKYGVLKTYLFKYLCNTINPQRTIRPIMNLNEIIANIVIPAAIAGILTPIIMKGILKTSWGQKIFKHKDNASEP